MATPLTDSINALTTYANEVTGASDTNLSDAVHTLASGYGGGCSWRKVYSTTIPLSTTNTGMVLQQRLETNVSELSSTESYVFIRIRDTLGKRNGYYYGGDEFYFPDIPNGSQARQYSVFQLRCENDSVKTGTSTQGLWIASINAGGTLILYSRYNATQTLTIDGTFLIEAYILDTPDGKSPYA